MHTFPFLVACMHGFTFQNQSQLKRKEQVHQFFTECSYHAAERKIL